MCAPALRRTDNVVCTVQREGTSGNRLPRIHGKPEHTKTWDGVTSRERIAYETIKKDDGFGNSHGNGAGDDQHGVRSFK